MIAIWWLANLVLVILNKLFKTTWVLGPLGCRSNPIRCHLPVGELEYLRRLTSLDGRPVLFRRVGSLMIPSPYGNIVDKYIFGFEGAGVVGRLYMDMYHQGYREDRAVPGLKLSEPPLAQGESPAAAPHSGPGPRAEGSEPPAAS